MSYFNDVDSSFGTVEKGLTLSDVASNSFPIWGTVVLLVLTRVEQFGINSRLQTLDPHASISLGTLGNCCP